MIGNHRNNRIFFSAVALAIVIIALFTAIPHDVKASTTSTVKVTKCSLNHTSVNNGSSTTITCTTTNNDQTNVHSITVQFSIQSTELVTFSIGSSNILSQTKSDVWQFSYPQNPLSTYSQPINAKAYLPSGYKSVECVITVTFFTDNKQFDTKTLDLKVK